jgi:Periplasmic copper-binding protein (NosD)
MGLMTASPHGSRRSSAVVVGCLAVLLMVCAACASSPPAPPPALDLAATYASPPAALAAGSSLPSLYVATTGDDGNAGTAAAPFRTIGHAASVATPGTTVIVADGTYEGAVVTRASGTESARIVYVAQHKWAAKIVGREDDTDAVWRNYGDYVDIQGFDVSGPVPKGTGIGQSGSHGRVLEDRVIGMAGNCMSADNDGYTIVDDDFIGNVVGRCGKSDLDHGIYPGGDGGTISNNISYGNTGFGIHCWHNCNRQVITNNLVFDNRAGGILIGQGDGPNNGEVEADGMLVANNIVVDNGDEGIRESGATGSQNRYVDNEVSDNAEGAVDLQSGAESGTISASPAFVDFQLDGSGDYRLQSYSAGVDGGSAEGAPPTDILGTPRPQGKAVDVGPFEQ